MTANLLDNTNSWYLGSDGNYTRRQIAEGEKAFSAHSYFMKNPSLSGRGKSLKYNPPSELMPVTKSKKSTSVKQKSSDVDTKKAANAN
jgi:polyphosphate kinase